jgi:hypothetical protein
VISTDQTGNQSQCTTNNNNSHFLGTTFGHSKIYTTTSEDS